MRKLLNRYLPTPTQLEQYPILRPLGRHILNQDLWRIRPHAIAGGIAVGLFCGLIPGPLQMLGSVVVCLLWRVNLPVALLATFYTNPLTILPLYAVAFAIGNFVLGGESRFNLPPEQGDASFWQWLVSLWEWLQQLGSPLALGLLCLASGLAVSGYFLTLTVWRAQLWYRLRQRKQRAHKATR